MPITTQAGTANTPGNDGAQARAARLVELTAPAPWQEYDCPSQKADTDLEGLQMVHQGQAFYCHWCGANHVAGVDVAITTHSAKGQEIDLPANNEELAALREGRPCSSTTREPA